MAEPGDPHQPDPEPVVTPEPEPQALPPVDVEPAPAPVRPDVPLHDDDHVGFASAAALVGQARPVAPQAEPDPEPLPEPVPEPLAGPEPDPGLAPVLAAPAVDAGSTFALSESFTRRRRAPADVPGSTGLFTVYALILFAVPTFGVAAVLGLLAVTGRPLPEDTVARSHLIFQQRTLWAAAVVAVLGAILIVVGVGVFILFALAIWVPVRGAFGLWQLKAGRAVSKPRSWLI